MKSLVIWVLVLGGIAFGVYSCFTDKGNLAVENKEMCIVEVSKRLLACDSDKECEKTVVRYAGYCYNNAEGNQNDICRGGNYYFYQPLKELAEKFPSVADLDKRQKSLVVRTGESYCLYNFND